MEGSVTAGSDHTGPARSLQPWRPAQICTGAAYAKPQLPVVMCKTLIDTIRVYLYLERLCSSIKKYYMVGDEGGGALTTCPLHISIITYNLGQFP